MKGLLGFVFILIIFWIINSGYFKPLLLELGAFSVIAVVFLTWKMKKQDGEFFPLIMPSFKLPSYLFWMCGQIISANIDVAKRIWLGRKSISPVIFQISSSQKTELGRTLFANSITITPGTITLFVDKNTLEIHALTKQAADELKKGELDTRVSALEVV